MSSVNPGLLGELCATLCLWLGDVCCVLVSSCFTTSAKNCSPRDWQTDWTSHRS